MQTSFRVLRDAPGVDALNSPGGDLDPQDSAAASRTLPPDDGTGTYQDLSAGRHVRRGESAA